MRRVNPTTLRVGTPSGELFDALFELELVCLFVENGYQIELEPSLKAWGVGTAKKPEFRAQRGALRVLVEAKTVQTDHIVFSNPDPPDGSFEVSEEATQQIAKNIVRNLIAARAKFIGVPEPHLIFVRSSFLVPHASVRTAMRHLAEDEPATRVPPLNDDSSHIGVVFAIPFEVLSYPGKSASVALDDLALAGMRTRLVAPESQPHPDGFTPGSQSPDPPPASVAARRA